MIWDTPNLKPRNQLYFLAEYWEEDFYDEEYEEDSYREMVRFHIPVAPERAACGYVNNGDYIDGTEIFAQLPHESERCENCWRINREGGGSVPPEDTSYGAQAGTRPGNPRGDTYLSEYTGYIAVGIPEGGVFNLAPGQRAEWDRLASTEQRQARVSAAHLGWEPRGSYRRRPVLRVIGRAGRSSGPVWMVANPAGA